MGGEESRAPPSRRADSLQLQRLAASLVLSAILAGGLDWRIVQQRRKEEAAREQVLTALRITSHALNQMNARLAARHRGAEN